MTQYWIVAARNSDYPRRPPEVDITKILAFPVFCSAPPSVLHGSHSGSGDSDFFPVETVLKYSCFPGENPENTVKQFTETNIAGYIIVGFAHAKCFLYNDTAGWFGPDLSCQREDEF